jgi:hypothetical protein
MNRSELERLVNKTFTAQGLLEGIEQEIAKAEIDIAPNELEVKRLEKLKATLSRQFEERDALKSKASDLRKEIDGYISTLSKNNVVLPFGSRSGGRVSL